MFEKNLKYYRLQKNMSKKDLAEACGVTLMAISNYESGKRMPDINTISKLADALDVRITDFLAPRNKKLSFNHGEFRKNSTLTKSQQEYVQESVEEYFSRFFDAVDCLGGNPLPNPPECRTLDRSDDFETDAVNLRKYLGFPSSGPVDEIISFLEGHGIIVLEIKIDNNKFSGMNGMVNEYPYIAINEDMRPERKRTTIIHELAHMMFKEASSDTDEEKRATAIAGAFLITKDDLFRELGLRRRSLTKDLGLICDNYGISMYLLVTRAAQVGIMSESLAKDFYIKANKAQWKTNEPSRVHYKESPMLLMQLVLRAINEEGVSIQRGAELLNMKYSDVEQYCGQVVI